MSIYCTNCGTEIPEGQNFCVNCGTPVVDDSVFAIDRGEEENPKDPSSDSSNIRKKESRIEVAVYCMVCGEEIPSGRRSCSCCGAPIGKQFDQAVQSGSSPEAAKELAHARKKKKRKRKGLYAVGLIVSALVLAVGIAGLIMHDKTPSPDNEEAAAPTTETAATIADSSEAQDAAGTLTEAEARKAGGLFVKSGDSYTPLQKTYGLKQNLIKGSDSCHSVYFMPAAEVEVPAVGKSDELVVFALEDSSGGGDDAEYEALEVEKTGFTVNALFAKDGIETGIIKGIEGRESEQDSHQMESLYAVNEMPAREFYKKETVNAKDYCSRESKDSADEGEEACDVALADLKRNEELSLFYSEGEEEPDAELTADLKYWIIDGCENTDDDKDAVILNVTGDETLPGTINVSKLEQGDYILRADAEADAYVIRIGEENGYEKDDEKE